MTETVLVGNVRTAEEREALIKSLESMTPGQGQKKLYDGVLESLRHGPFTWEEYQKLSVARDSFKKTGKQVAIAWMNGQRQDDDFSWLKEDKLRDCDLCPAKVPMDKTRAFTEDGDEYEVCEDCYKKFAPKGRKGPEVEKEEP